MSNADSPAEQRPAVPFIVGVSRSGTTLLRLMLDAHRDLTIPAETHFLTEIVTRPDHAWTSDEIADVVVAASTWPNLHLDEGRMRADLARLDPFTIGDAVRVVMGQCAARRGTSRWGDKTPAYRRALPEIAAVLPEARFVHIIRDGRDVAVSYRGLWFGPDDLAEAAEFWRDEITATRAAAERLGAEQYLELRYEDLVIDPESTLRRVCAFVDLAYEPTMLAYHREAAERLAEHRTAPRPPGSEPVDVERFLAIHDGVQHPPDATRIGRWRQEMSPTEVALFEDVAGPLLADLGYELSVTTERSAAG